MDTLVGFEDDDDEFKNLPLIPRVSGVTIYRCWWKDDDGLHWCLVSKQAITAWANGLKFVGIEDIWSIS